MISWDKVIADPNLRDLPYKLELGAHGRIEMSPSKPQHGRLQVLIAIELSRLLPHGKVMTECPIKVGEKVRVPDVVWVDRQTETYIADQSAMARAPEICIEILSPSNSATDIDSRRNDLAAVGCLEFWTCTEAGEILFFNARDGSRLPASRIAPDFPSTLNPD